jgi:hypothetical protein
MLSIDGVCTVMTKFSRNDEEIGDFLQGQIAKQLFVHKRVFQGMIDCYISKESYYQMLKENPDIAS